MGDNTQKRDGFGIGEAGRVSEADATERAMLAEHRRQAQERARRADCHYCGMPATSVGFFDEPVCEDCSH